MNFISFIIKFIKFKPIIKFKKFERHKFTTVLDTCALAACPRRVEVRTVDWPHI